MRGRSAEDKDESDDPDKWLWMHCEGSRDGYKDIELFIGTVRDPGRADRLEIAICGRGAFRRFKDVLARTHALPRLRRVFAAATAARRVWPVRQKPGARPNAIPEITNRGFRRARAVETTGLAAPRVSIVA